MNQIVKSTIKYILVFIVTFTILVGSLIAVALIPKEQIKPKAKESAVFFCEHEVQTLWIDFVKSSQNDYFADCILLNIAYHLDKDHPVESTMKAAFYGKYDFNTGKYLRYSIINNMEPDHEYIRYWHGSIVPVRIMLLFWNIKQMYIFHAILLTILLIILMWLLAKNGFLAEGICLCVSLIIIQVWFVPMALEYTWMFLIMLIVSIIAVWLVCKGWTDHFGELFLITGMVTVFLDFLTTETLTITVPLLFILRLSEKKPLKESNLALFSFKCCSLWLIGYIGMWVSKWIMASIVLKMNVMPYVTEHIEERSVGSVGFSSLQEYLIKAVTLNLKRLFPYEYGIFGAVLLFVVLFLTIMVPVLMNKVRLQSQIDWKRISLYFGLGLIPFARLLVMHNHAVIHCFFAFRAFAATVLAICFIGLELVEKNERKETT